jgi:hypothetical protein
VHTVLGVTLIVGASVALVAAAFVLHPRAPGAVTAGVAVVAGVALASGALLVQPRASSADWAVALGAMALLAPAHVRVVFGPFGRSGPAGPSGPSGGVARVR